MMFCLVVLSVLLCFSSNCFTFACSKRCFTSSIVCALIGRADSCFFIGFSSPFQSLYISSQSNPTDCTCAPISCFATGFSATATGCCLLVGIETAVSACFCSGAALSSIIITLSPDIRKRGFCGFKVVELDAADTLAVEETFCLLLVTVVCFSFPLL